MKREKHELIASTAGRIDKVLSIDVESALGTHAPTRSQLQMLIEEQGVEVNGKLIKKTSAKINIGDKLVFEILSAKPTKLKPTPFPLDIVFEDPYLIVVNKPAGMTVHPGAGKHSVTLVQAVLAHVGDKLLKVGEADRPGIVHRLDKDTTGLMVVAKDVATHAHLAKMFAKHEISRSYLALVLLTPRSGRLLRTKDQGEVDAAIGRDPTNRKKRAVLKEGGKRAITRWSVEERMKFAALITATLATGRTHQIRVHMDKLGCPVIGDQVYGEFSLLPASLRRAATQFGRQALHSATLSFVHPHSGKKVEFKSDPPKDFLELCQVFRAGS